MDQQTKSEQHHNPVTGSEVVADSSQTISTLAGGATLGAVLGGPEGAIVGGILGLAIGGGTAIARHLKG